MFYWYRCDYGHEWLTYSTNVVNHSGVEKLCPEGHEAVEEFLEKPARNYYVSVLPAERFVAAVQGYKVVCKGMYYIMANDIRGQSSYISREPFTLTVACNMVQQLMSEELFDPSQNPNFLVNI